VALAATILIDPPALRELTTLRGTVIEVWEHRARKVAPQVRVALSTIHDGWVVVIQYDNYMSQDVHRIRRGDDLEVLAERDVLGRALWFAWQVAANGETIATYAKFVERDRRMNERTLVVAAMVLVFGVALFGFGWWRSRQGSVAALDH
jgi:hypothetical protein